MSWERCETLKVSIKQPITLGGAVSTLVSVVDKRSKFVFIRPLRDVAKKEISIYNHLMGIDSHCIQIKIKNDVKSVQSLTDSFIHTLEAEKFYV